MTHLAIGDVLVTLAPFTLGAWMLVTMVRNRKAVRQREAHAARLASSTPVEITRRKAIVGSS